jgi:rhodanese-related sulfurtransferase
MKKTVFAVVATCLIGVSSLALAAGAEEAAAIQKAAEAYLGAVPADSYLITADKLLERINSGKNDFVIYDVRIPKEKTYDQGHIPGALHLGYKDFAKPENLAKLPKDKDIILYCNTGQDENKDLTVLRMLGYKAYGLKWGYLSWKAAPPTDLTLKAIDGSKSGKYLVEK